MTKSQIISYVYRSISPKSHQLNFSIFCFLKCLLSCLQFQSLPLVVRMKSVNKFKWFLFCEVFDRWLIGGRNGLRMPRSEPRIGKAWFLSHFLKRGIEDFLRYAMTPRDMKLSKQNRILERIWCKALAMLHWNQKFIKQLSRNLLELLKNWIFHWEIRLKYWQYVDFVVFARNEGFNNERS